MAKKKIGILTGGGDVPGLNAVIKSVVYGSSRLGREVVGIRRGWKGLVAPDWTHGRDDYHFEDLNRENTRTIDRTGGTYLHTSRTKPNRTKLADVPKHLLKRLGEFDEVDAEVFDLTPLVIENLDRLGVDYLVPIGGDDTLSYAHHLNQEVPMVCVPKTMDNDVRNTEYCIGFSTALTRAVDAIGRQRTTIGSHERIGIFRIFGRDAGFTALYTAYITSERCCIPEYKEINLEKLIGLLKQDQAYNPSNYAIVILAEGASWEDHQVREYGEPDAYGHRKKMSVAEDLSDEIKAREGLGTVVSDLTYDLRGGEPDFLDKMVATTFATMAVECIGDGGRGKMAAIQKGCYTLADLPDASGGPRSVNVEKMYNTDRYRPSYPNKTGMPIMLTELD